MRLNKLLSERFSSPSPVEIPQVRDDTDVLRTSARIIPVLERAFEQRILLTVAVQGKDDLFASVILEVNESGGYLVLDELRPKDGHMALGPKTRLHVSARLDGIMMSFSAPVLQIEQEAAGAYYKIPIPDSLNYCQKRNHFRADVPVTHSVPVLLVVSEKHSLAGELRDLSLGGFSMRLNPGPPHRLVEGDHVDPCILHLQNKQTIEVEVEICHIDDVHPGRRPRLGAKFVALDARKKRAIEALVAELERETLRRLARNQ